MGSGKDVCEQWEWSRRGARIVGKEMQAGSGGEVLAWDSNAHGSSIATGSKATTCTAQYRQALGCVALCADRFLAPGVENQAAS